MGYTIIVPDHVMPRLRMLAKHYEGRATGVVLDDTVQRLVEVDFRRVFPRVGTAWDKAPVGLPLTGDR